MDYRFVVRVNQKNTFERAGNAELSQIRKMIDQKILEENGE